MSKNLIIAIVVLILIIAGWFVMRPKREYLEPVMEKSSSSTESASPQQATGAGMMEVKEINVSGAEFSFTPKSISVKKGEKVKLVFKNDGKLPHDFKIDELGVATKVTAVGVTDTVEFTAEKTGTFPIYCSVGDHRAKGMEGFVDVE